MPTSASRSTGSPKGWLSCFGPLNGSSMDSNGKVSKNMQMEQSNAGHTTQYAHLQMADTISDGFPQARIICSSPEVEVVIPWLEHHVKIVWTATVFRHRWISRNPETFIAARTRLQELYFTRTLDTRDTVTFKCYNLKAAKCILADASSAKQSLGAERPT